MAKINCSIPINSSADLGFAVRATRRAQGLRQDDVAGSAGVGALFAIDVEHGADTVQLGRVLRLLRELGIELYAEIPPAALAEFQEIKRRGVRPLKRRRRAANIPPLEPPTK